jgi:hypothetical protein
LIITVTESLAVLNEQSISPAEEDTGPTKAPSTADGQYKLTNQKRALFSLHSLTSLPFSLPYLYVNIMVF